MTDRPTHAPSNPPPVGPGSGELRMQVPPWVQLVGLPLVVLFGFVFVRAASHAVVVFLIATLVSLLLAPVVRALVAAGLPRLLSVLAVFGAFAAVVTLLTLAAVELTVSQASEVRGHAERISEAAVERIDGLQDFANDRGIDVDLRDQSVRFVNQLEERSAELSSEALRFGREFVTVLAEAAFNLVLIIVITVYMLLDAPRISRFVASLLPAASGVDQLFGRLQRSLLRYTIGQTMASAVMGVSATLGLVFLDLIGAWNGASDYAILFGVIVAVTEFAPSIGPAIGSVPPIVTAAFAGPGAAISVAILFLLLHQIEGHIVVPKLMGAAIAVHPLLVIFGILAGAQIMGVGGILLALPILAVGREIALFIRERVALGTWNSPLPGAALGGVAVATTAPVDPGGTSAGSQPFAVSDRVRAIGGRLRGRLRRGRAEQDTGVAGRVADEIVDAGSDATDTPGAAGRPDARE